MKWVRNSGENPPRSRKERRVSSSSPPAEASSRLGHPVEARDLHQHPQVRRAQRVTPRGEETGQAERAGVLQRDRVVAHRHRHLGVLGLHAELVEEPEQVGVGALVVHDEARVDRHPVDHVGVGVATEPGVRLVERHLRLLAQHVRSSQPGDPTAYDCDASGDDPGHASALLEVEQRDRLARRLLGSALGLDGDADSGGFGGVALQHDGVVASGVHQAGWVHRPDRRPGATARRPCPWAVRPCRGEEDSLALAQRAHDDGLRTVLEGDRGPSWRQRRRGPARLGSAWRPAVGRPARAG